MKHGCRYNLFLALFMILVLRPASSEAGYLVEFQNGRSVRAETYRVEGKSYELYLESGSLRVSKEEIRSIQEKKDDVVRSPAGEAEKDKPETPEDLKKQGPSKNSALQGIAIESTLKRKVELREKIGRS